MDRRSWLWRRKSSEKSLGESESSGSVSSENFSDEQEALRASSINGSPNHAKSPDISSPAAGREVHETVKSLNEKLSAALSSISAKEDLVKQHAKVAEEAVAGWEKAEYEVATLKQQLEATSQRNSALEDRIGHLDGALKECVRQLRQSREEHEQKLHGALIKKTNEWESKKFELETRLVELQAQLEANKTEASISADHDLQLKFEALKKENSDLKTVLLVRSDDLRVRTLERELSTQTAETASKQHLESIKKVSKLEAECRRLRVAARKPSPFNDHGILTNSVCVESITDSQSDSGERLFGVDNDLSCSDSWASALIAELDQFKNNKGLARNLNASSIEFDLMNDFLEMEKLAALPEAYHGSSNFEIVSTQENQLKAELEALQRKVSELEEKIQKMAVEKEEGEKVLAETRDQLKKSCNQLTLAGDKLAKLQQHLNSSNGSKHVLEMEVEAVELRRKELESQLKSSHLEVEKLSKKAVSLEKKSKEFAAKCQDFDAKEAKVKELEAQLESAHLDVQKLHEKVKLLEGKLHEERALSANFATVEKKKLESQLKSAHLEAEELREKVALLERELKVERALSAELKAELEGLMEKEKALNSQLESEHLESRKLHEKMVLLEKEMEVERAMSSEFAAKCQNLDAQLSSACLEVEELTAKMSLLKGEVEGVAALQSKLKSAHLEIDKLHEKMSLLEMAVENEKALSAMFAAKCEGLENEMLKKTREVELRRPISSNGELEVKQEREHAVAAGKLAECQKTIASLSQQLKSLAAFDDTTVESDEPEIDNKENLSGSSALPNGKEKSSFIMPGLLKLLSPSRTYNHAENH